MYKDIDTRKKIVRIVKRHPSIRVYELAEKLQMPRNRLNHYIASLILEGKIEKKVERNATWLYPVVQ